MKYICFTVMVVWSLGGLNCLHGQGNAPPVEMYDLVVYGATSAGIVAAVQAKRMGLDVVLLEPSRHLGGLTTGGLGATDIGNKQAIGGISQEFYRRLGAHYELDEAWRFEQRSSYRSARQRPGEREMWTFEPHVAAATYLTMLQEASLTWHPNSQLDRESGVVCDAQRVVSIRLRNGQQWHAHYFMDCTYEGDLMAAARVAYVVGREFNHQYRESLNGIQHHHAVHHQFQKPVDPYRIPGDAKSGLLDGVQSEDAGLDGEGDHRVQAYNFRMCLTDVPENRRPWRKPDGYAPERYELLARYFAAGFSVTPWHIIMMPNRKTDINNNHAFSTDFIGANYRYPEASYEERTIIWDAHIAYQKGLMWFLASDPRVPQNVQQEVNKWGLCRDEFTENDGWPTQLYVRETRRMVGEVVMTEAHCRGEIRTSRSIGMAAYTMDSHNTQRIVRDGVVRNEGDVQVGGFPPYPIDLGAILPKRGECENLLVPVCLSATHIAYGSIRMEPVFMVLGQSAASIVAQVLPRKAPVQDVDYDGLRMQLLKDRQVLQ